MQLKSHAEPVRRRRTPLFSLPFHVSADAIMIFLWIYPELTAIFSSGTYIYALNNINNIKRGENNNDYPRS